MDLTGQRIADRYDIVQLLGEGGMAQVYEARHVELDKRVAIKFLFVELAEDEELLERFRREARITAALRHVNIVEVMDFGVTDDDLPYIVMEYLTGESLSEILEREGTLTVSAARKIIYQILSGLAEAHDKGIVHRDLKPDNVYLDEVAGQGTVIKLLDFGISKIASKDQEENLQLTKTGVVMGTPNYMSPEQVMGTVEVDSRADLYACGTILFEMLTGRRPFEGETHNEVVVHIMSDPVPDMRTLRDDIGPDLINITLKALSRDRDLRFATAEEFMEAIEEIDSDGPSVSLTQLRLSPPAFLKKKKPSWLLPAAAGAAGLVLVVVVAIVLITTAVSRTNKKDDLVTVTPRGAPEAAVILHDGKEIPLEEFTLPRDDEPVIFTVRAPGYRDGEFEVVPDQDRQVRIHLLPFDDDREVDENERKADEKQSKAKAPPEEKPAKAKPEPKKPEPKKTKKKKKKKSSNPFRALVRELKK